MDRKKLTEMTAEELLPILEDRHIKFGTDYGKKFFICDSGKKVMEEIDRIDDKCFKRFMQQKAIYENRIAECTQDISAFKHGLEWKGIDEAHREDLEKRIESLEKKRKTATEYLNSIIDRLNKRIPLRKRRIVDIRNSLDCDEPEGTLIVIVQGYERGRYWMTKEYKGEVDMYVRQ